MHLSILRSGILLALLLGVSVATAQTELFFATGVDSTGWAQAQSNADGHVLIESPQYPLMCKSTSASPARAPTRSSPTTPNGRWKASTNSPLPEGAIITDLVLWIGDKRIQGMVLEKEEARRTYDDIVGRRIDPALIEQVTPNQFRLSIFPFPAQGSRRVEFEYMQLLESHSGRLDYSFPLAPETDQPLQMELFVLRAQVRSQHAFEATTSGLPPLPEIDRPDAHHANIFFGDEQVKPREDFTLTIRQTDDRPKPTVLSFAPQPNDDLGYYALWLPPLPELTQGEPLPRSLTFVIDISSSMQQGKLQAVKGALIAAIDRLDAADLFNIVVFTHRADSFAAAPVPADPANKKAATAFINQQDALGVSNFEAGLGRAMQQAFPANRVNHVIFLTDGLPTLGELDLELLSEMVGEWSAGQARLFTIGVGQDVDQGFLTRLGRRAPRQGVLPLGRRRYRSSAPRTV